MIKMENKFENFCSIIEKLRAPDGCPWDREQTHKTLAKCLIEEAYEAHDALMDNEPKKMADELGDVLLQVVMNAQIGKEEHTFDIEDVIDAVTEKMIVRHPHVFGDMKGVENAEQVLENWDKIKRDGRGQKKVYQSMESITKSLPALLKCDKIIDKALKLGIDIADVAGVEKIESQDADSDRVASLIFSACILARQKNIDSEQCLDAFLNNFITQIKNIEENT